MHKLIAVLSLLAVSITLGSATEKMPLLVTPQWLQQHLNDQDLVIIQVGFSRKDWAREHIPGSRFLWFDYAAPSNPDLSTELPPTVQADTLLEGLGVSDDSRIVVYFTGSSLSTTTRVLLTLDYFGLGDRTALLDGGFSAWKRSGGAITKEPARVTRGHLTVHPQPSLIVDAEFVRTHLSDRAFTVIDARSKSFYDGSGTGGGRPGHVRGAVSLPFSAVVDTLNQYKPQAELQKLFAESGVRKGSTLIVYCHVGQQATAVIYAARLLGVPARLYDGSYTEWESLDEQYPVDNPGEKKP